MRDFDQIVAISCVKWTFICEMLPFVCIMSICQNAGFLEMIGCRGGHIDECSTCNSASWVGSKKDETEERVLK